MPCVVGAEAQHVDAFGAQKRHAGRVGLRGDSGPGEVLAQMRADLGQDVGHSPGGSMVRLIPESASKIASLVVSNASSAVWPCVTFDSVETRATNSFSPTPDSAASSASWAECAPAPSVLKWTYLSAPSDSTRSTSDLEGQRPDPGIAVEQRRVLEVLRADTDDHVGRFLVPREHVVDLLGQHDFAERQAHPDVGQGRREEVHRRGSDEPGDEQVGGTVVELLRRADLLSHPGQQHHHPIAQRHRLGLVVRDVNGGGAQPILQPRDLRTHRHPQLGVQIRQRLVHQKRLGVADDGAAHGDPLALTAGQLSRLAVQKVGQVKDFRGLLDLAGDLGLLHLRQGEREGDVLPHGHVRIEGIGLEHHRDVTILGRLVVDPLAADAQLARRDLLQAGNHVQRRGLSTAGRSDQDDELAVGDRDGEIFDGRRAVRVTLGHPVQHNFGHRATPSPHRTSNLRRSVVGRSEQR